MNGRNWRDICSFHVSTEIIVHVALWELNFADVHLYFSVIPPFDYFIFNPLTPKSDQHLISPTLSELIMMLKSQLEQKKC